MMMANIDVLYVHLYNDPNTDQIQVNLFNALNQLRAQGYDTPKIAPFLDPMITWYQQPLVDLATTAGKDTFVGSLDCLRPFGLLASFGNSSGPVPPFEIGTLAPKGSLYVTRPTLGTYVAKREDLESTAKELFDVVLSGKVKIEIEQRYALEDAAQAHRDLEARKTTGSTVLIP